MKVGPTAAKEHPRYPTTLKKKTGMSPRLQNKTATVFRFAHVSSGCDTSWTMEGSRQ